MEPNRVIQAIGIALARTLKPRIEVVLWCDECEHLAPLLTKKRTEYCSCCGLQLPRKSDAINYEGTN